MSNGIVPEFFAQCFPEGIPEAGDGLLPDRIE